MAGAQAGAVVAVEVLVEEDQVAPVRVFLELACPAVDRPPAALVLQEDARESTAEFLGYLIEGHHSARARRALDLELVAVVGVVLQQCADDQSIDRRPDWA